MITTVTLNPAIDKTLILNELNLGKVNRVLRSRENIGGKGINVSKIVSKLGDKTKAITLLGRNNLDYVRNLIKKSNIDSIYYEVEGLTRTNTKVVDLKNNITTDINEIGFEIEKDLIADIIQFIAKNLSNSDFIVLSGSVPKGFPIDIYSKIIENTNSNTKFVVDTEGEQLLNVFKNALFLIKPNIHELEDALGIKLDSTDKIVTTCLSLIDRYKIDNILVSMGGDGSILVSNDVILKAEPVKVELRSTVGAGDSLVAGFIHGMLNYDMDKYEALKFGSACGTLAVSKDSIDDLTKTDIQMVADSIMVRQL